METYEGYQNYRGYDEIRNVKVTLQLDHVRRCRLQSLDPDHYTAGGPCLCETKRASIIGEEPRPDLLEKIFVPRINISRAQMRPYTSP
jgi:hypothetical protein